MIFWLLFSLLVVNLFAFVYVGMDKNKSIKGSERFSEVSFFLIALFFASLGVLLGLVFFRHKTKKVYFVFGMVLLFILQAILVSYFINFLK